MSKFYIGQPVVCINDRFGRVRRNFGRRFNLRLPVRGSRYIVRAYSDGPPPACILVSELSNPRILWSDSVWREAAFGEFRFEPATEKQVSKMLSEAPFLFHIAKQEEDA